MNPENARNQRRRRYVDPILQGRLIAGLIALELVLFSGALVIIYRNLDNAIAEQIFRAHSVPTGSLPILATELMQIVPWILIANIAMVGVAYWVWTRAVRQVIDPLKGLLAAIASLDLRNRTDLEGQHDLIEQARQFLVVQRERGKEIQTLVDALEPASTQDERAKILTRLRAVLS